MWIWICINIIKLLICSHDSFAGLALKPNFPPLPQRHSVKQIFRGLSLEIFIQSGPVGPVTNLQKVDQSLLQMCFAAEALIGLGSSDGGRWLHCGCCCRLGQRLLEGARGEKHGDLRPGDGQAGTHGDGLWIESSVRRWNCEDESSI